jgi:predicted lipoprotein with Yx(FWY)xxD motif
MVLEATTTQYGAFLTDAKGFALYTYTADMPGGSGCTGHCLVLWPPLLLPAGAMHPDGAPGISGLGTVARSGGLQVTYRGLPLYTFIKDKQPRQVTGQKVVDSGGTWYLATVAAPGASTTTVPFPTVSRPSATTPPTTAAHTPATEPPPTQPSAPQPPATPPPPTPPPPTQPPPTTPRTTPPTTAPPGGPTY